MEIDKIINKIPDTTNLEARANYLAEHSMINEIINIISNYTNSKAEMISLRESFGKAKLYLSSLDKSKLNKIEENIIELVNQIKERKDNHSNPEFNQKEFCRLGTIYLILAGTDINRLLEIDSRLLYYVLTNMRTVPPTKYNESLDKLLYPKFNEIMIKTGPIDDIRIILWDLFDDIETKEYDRNKLDEDMNKFLIRKVYTKLGLPVELNNNDVKFEVSKVFILEKTDQAISVKSSYSKELEAKKEIILINQNFTPEEKQKYLEFETYLKQEITNLFEITSCLITLIGIIKEIDICTKSNEEILVQIKIYKNKDISEYKLLKEYNISEDKLLIEEPKKSK